MIVLLTAEPVENRVVVGTVSIIVTLFAFFFRKAGGGGSAPLFLGIVAGMATLYWHALPTPIPDHLLNKTVTLDGLITDREDRYDSTSFLMEQGVILPEKNHLPGTIKIILNPYQHLTPSHVMITPGTRVRFKARLRRMTSFSNPGGLDYAANQRQQGIQIMAIPKSPLILIKPTIKQSWNGIRYAVSEWISKTLPDNQQGLAQALMVGKRGGLDSETREHLMVSGTIHLVAISGLHLGLVATGCFLIFRMVLVLCWPLSNRFDVKPIAAGLSIVPMFLYAFLAGWSISTQRAAIMVGLFLLAVALGRSRQIWRVLSLAASIILLHQPSALFSAGFQLSFLAVAGLIFFLPDDFQGHGWRKKVLVIVLSTLVASLVTAPIAAYHFHRAAPYGLMANLLAVPGISFVSIPLSLSALLTQPIHPGLGDFLLQLSGYSLELFQKWIVFTSSLPGASQRLAGPSWIGLVLSCGLFALAGMMTQSLWRWFCLLLIFPALLWPHHSPPKDQLHLAVLDVGQAQSVVVHQPGGDWSIVDVGSGLSSYFNLGERVTSNYLWYYGVQRLKRIVISHPQQDHMGGVERVLRNFKVDNLWLGDFPLEEMDNARYYDLINLAENQGVDVRRFRHSFQQQEERVRWRILPPLLYENSKNHNDRSLVVEIGIGNHRFLLPGDATSNTEKWLLSQKTIKPVTMVLAPHHGSKSSSSFNFVQATHPKHLVFSVGLNNRHHHPHPKVVKIWKNSGSTLWRTDQNGAVVFQSDGQTVTVTVAKKPNDP